MPENFIKESSLQPTEASHRIFTAYDNLVDQQLDVYLNKNIWLLNFSIATLAFETASAFQIKIRLGDLEGFHYTFLYLSLFSLLLSCFLGTISRFFLFFENLINILNRMYREKEKISETENIESEQKFISAENIFPTSNSIRFRTPRLEPARTFEFFLFKMISGKSEKEILLPPISQYFIFSGYFTAEISQLLLYITGLSCFSIFATLFMLGHEESIGNPDLNFRLFLAAYSFSAGIFTMGLLALLWRIIDGLAKKFLRLLRER